MHKYNQESIGIMIGFALIISPNTPGRKENEQFSRNEGVLNHGNTILKEKSD